jgi:broad specificity phosphatase PhoE
MRKIQLVLLAVLLAAPAAARAQSVVFLVRHAERADAGMAAGKSTDPDLSDAGRARADALAAMLKDARISEVFVTALKRTHQTAAPIARLLGVTVTQIAGNDVTGLTARLKAATGNTLVVGHSNTIPAIIKALGIDEEIVIGDTEFDQLFVVVRSAKPLLVRLRYR